MLRLTTVSRYPALRGRHRGVAGEASVKDGIY